MSTDALRRFVSSIDRDITRSILKKHDRVTRRSIIDDAGLEDSEHAVLVARFIDKKTVTAIAVKHSMSETQVKNLTSSGLDRIGSYIKTL